MRNFITVIIAALLLGVTGSAYALSLQQAEINGDGKLGFSFDNGDGIVWLDNDETIGKTITEMNTIAVNYGLQWADKNMVITLHQNLNSLTSGWTSSDSSTTGAAYFSDSTVTQSQLNGYFPTAPSSSVSSMPVPMYQISEWRVSQYTDGTADNYFSNMVDVFVSESYSTPTVGGWLYKMGDDLAPMPEPATMLLFGIGLLGLAGVNRRKK